MPIDLSDHVGLSNNESYTDEAAEGIVSALSSAKQTVAEIARERAILLQREQELSDVVLRYRRALVPRRNLLKEVYSYIFILCASQSPLIPFRRRSFAKSDSKATDVELERVALFATQVIVSWVCSTWRQIALDTPQLWRRICVDYSKPAFIESANQYLSRARHLPPVLIRQDIKLPNLRWLVLKISCTPSATLQEIVGPLVFPNLERLGIIERESFREYKTLPWGLNCEHLHEFALKAPPSLRSNTSVILGALPSIRRIDLSRTKLHSEVYTGLVTGGPGPDLREIVVSKLIDLDMLLTMLEGRERTIESARAGGSDGIAVQSISQLKTLSKPTERLCWRRRGLLSARYSNCIP
ncbi:hypothetical protein AX15_005125 [Amanita polypyramis BW_CC]|nr:hypothetical protein AX15_005125 [Amanita polypyramis BW_CC]